MVNFKDWCDIYDQSVNDHCMWVMAGRNKDREIGIKATVAVVPKHYISAKLWTSIMNDLDKPKTAKIVIDRFPKVKKARYGDIGEIYATEWINEIGEGYYVPINRLERKLNPDTAMPGVDAIGMYKDSGTGHYHFLKVEAKCHKTVTGSTLRQARAQLDEDGGLLSGEALVFVAEHLRFLNEDAFANEIFFALKNQDITPENVRHLIFTFSDKAPDKNIYTYLKAYDGGFRQWMVGLYMERRVDFINEIFQRAISSVK